MIEMMHWNIEQIFAHLGEVYRYRITLSNGENGRARFTSA
jgi:hypothetical protein